MELNLDSRNASAPVRDAASVVLLRDGGAGLEVFLLRRHGQSEVLGGAYVFPGGKLDAEDTGEAMLSRVDGDLRSLHEALGEPDLPPAQAGGLYVAAIREAFEETGVLLASGAADPALAWAKLREGRSFAGLVLEQSLSLDANALQPWSRWITPAVGGVMRKRFDTRFFLARLPQGQVAGHDNHEAVDSAWLSPREALQQYWRGDIELAPPQIIGLAHLARHASVESAFAQARARRPPLVHPEPVASPDGTRILCYPGDECHTVRERALPGPTRLHFRDGRFEPPGGFDALFEDE